MDTALERIVEQILFEKRTKMKAQRKGGRPSHEPSGKDRKTVECMASYGIKQEEIAAVIGVDSKTLRAHYRNELDLSSTKANALVAQSLFAKATATKCSGPSVTAAIFWLKTRAGWKERDVHEITGADGGPIEVDDARSKLADRLARLAAASAAREGSGEPQPE